MNGHIPPAQLDSRLAEAVAAVRRAQEVRRRQVALGRSECQLREAQRHLKAFEQERAAEIEQLRSRLAFDARLTAVGGDPWAIANEVRRLRAEKVPSHQIARSLLRLGYCRTSEAGGVVDLNRCQTRLRKEVHRSK